MKYCPTCNNRFDDASAFCPNDGEVLQESPDSIVGQVIEGKYKIEGFIAQGGMGAVYRARHILLGDEVVIKTLRSEMRNNSEWLRRFQREGKAARAFRHPNSVTVYDLSAGTDGLIYMVMEYVEGHTLDKELKRRKQFTPEEAIEVLEPVADVLDAAHARGVVHRDLKPENIMLGKTDAGHVIIKVLDLGIAKIIGAGDIHAAEATSLTVAGQILGTPYYMSPEQWGEIARDGNPEIDGRTDIYSLGVILFELIAGRKPLGGRTLSELRHKHVASPLPALSDLAPDVPEAFSHAVGRAMAKDRNDRPGRAGELIEELRSALGLAAKGRQGGVIRLSEPESRSYETSDMGMVAPDAATAHYTPSETGALERSKPVTFQTGAPDQSGASDARNDTAPSRDATGDSSRPTVIIGPASGTRAGYEESAVRQTRVAAPGANGAAAASQITVQADERSAQSSIPSHVPPVAPSRSMMPVVIAGVGLVLLLLVGVGGWLALRGRGTPNENVATTNQPTTTNAAANVSAPPIAGNNSAQPSAPKVEAMSYWLETFDSLEATAGERVADAAASVPSGKRFVFHFRAPERGYLYIIGPGEGNAPTTFLTAKGAGALATNLVPANADFVFPAGGAKLRLDDMPGADEFTVIFSPAPLSEPAFLNREFMRKLTPSEVKELEDLRARSDADASSLETKEDAGTRRVAVNVARDGTAARKPLVFDVRINHR